MQPPPTTDVNPTLSPKSNNLAKEIQEAILNMSKLLTDRMDVLHNAVLKEIREIKQDVQTLTQDVQVLKQDVQVLKQDTQNHATRLDRLEADMTQSTINHSSRRSTPYSRPHIDTKSTTSSQDGLKQ